MNIPRDNSPERRSDQERLESYRLQLEENCLYAKAALFTEFAEIWGGQTETASTIATDKPTRAFTGAAAAVNFTVAEGQREEAAQSQHVSDSRRMIEEALNEPLA